MHFLRFGDSFATRVSVELETENLKVTTGIELQKLGIVPQTVFLRNRATEPTARSARLSSRRSNSDHPGRSPTSGTPRTTRTSSIDHGPPSGAPFEDLRRRLATINGSTTSLSMSPSSRDVRNSLPSVPLQGLGLGDSFDRPGSPADSVISTSNSSALKGVHRLQIGSIDSQKAAPAVGSSKANATGLLEAASRMRDGSPDRSGRSSPVSVSGTLRPQQRHRVPSLLPISSYGEFKLDTYINWLKLGRNRWSRARHQQSLGTSLLGQ
jgi:phosphoinositide-3-kinase regulatory subunit 4